jgi:hypothetical protein
MADTDSKPITPNELHSAVEEIEALIEALGAMLNGFFALAGKARQLRTLLEREAEPAKALIASADAAHRRFDDINAEIARHDAAMKRALSQVRKV